MLENNVSFLKAPCTGCGACEVICGKEAINIQMSKEGFFEAVVDKATCINCGKCLDVCIRAGDFTRCSAIKDGKLVAARSTDSIVLQKASSGGAVSEFYKTALSKGYKIIGTEYDLSKEKAMMQISDSVVAINRFAGSKYIQSYTCDALEEVVCYAKSDKHHRAIVVGTPCQIYGINNMLHELKIRDQFILVDFFCHGVPSYLVWNSYLKYIKSRLNVSKIDNVVFRDKGYGWHNYWIKVEAEGKQYSSLGALDCFYTAFFDNQFVNKSCLNCKLRGEFSGADIRVGDFWGKQFENDDDGVSAIVKLTKRGGDFFNQCSNIQVLGRYELSDIMPYQSCDPYKENPLRDQIFKKLFESQDLTAAMKIYQKQYSITKKGKLAVKRVLRKLPNKIILFLWQRKII